MIKIYVEQGSEAWFQSRLGRITASKFKDLISGESTLGYKGLIVDVAAEIVSGEIEETFTDFNMERGNDLEPEARETYAKLFEIKVEQIGFCIPDEDNEFHDWIGISPDGGMNKFKQLLEIKCPKKRTHWNYIKANKLPSAYKPQVQAQLFVTGAEYCDFMSYYPNMKPFVHRVYPDEEMFKMFKERLRITITRIKEEIEGYKKYDYLD